MSDGRDNLIPPSQRTSDELREMTRKGGIKSGEVRRAKKSMRQMMEMMLHDVPLPEGWRKALREQGISEDDWNHKAVVTIKLIQKAEEGDVAAYNAICAMVGEKPKDEVAVDTRIEIGFVDSGGYVPVHSEDEVEE